MRGRAWSFARTGARRSRASGAASMCNTIFAGVLFEGSNLENNSWFMNPNLGQFAFLSPQTGGRVRAYAWYPNDRGYRLQGAADLPRFVQESVKAGVPAQWYSGLRAAGPLATL
jgi:hypothetical protein